MTAKAGLDSQRTSESAAPEGSPLRRRRLAAGYTLEELADLVGVTASAISQIETGSFGPGADLKVRLARTFRVRVRDLFPSEPIPSDTSEGAA